MSATACPKGSLILMYAFYHYHAESPAEFASWKSVNAHTRVGATGTIGLAVTNEVLKAGYKVRAAVRNVEKGQLVAEIFRKRYGPGIFSTVAVSDMAEPGALDDVMKDCAGVVNLASEMGFLPDPNKIIAPSVALVNNLLATAAKTSSVKRFVFTSSTATLPRLTEPGNITSSSWLPNADDVIAHAWAEPYTADKSPAVYTASKISAERACWDFVRREKPGFVLNTVVPGFAIGEIFHPQLISSSNGAVLGMTASDPFAVGFIRGVTPGNYTGLEDCGLLHLAALATEEVRGERLLALGEVFDFNQMVDLLEQLAPGSNLPSKVDAPGKSVASIDTAREEELLKAMGKNGFTPLEESVKLCLSRVSVQN